MGFVVQLQARVRGFLARREFTERSLHLRTWLPAVTKIQVVWRPRCPEGWAQLGRRLLSASPSLCRAGTISQSLDIVAESVGSGPNCPACTQLRPVGQVAQSPSVLTWTSWSPPCRVVSGVRQARTWQECSSLSPASCERAWELLLASPWGQWGQLGGHWGLDARRLSHQREGW